MLTKTKTTSKRVVTDEQLIARFQQGDVQAFDILVRRYKDQLLNYIFRFVGNRSDAEDIVQETFLRVYKNKHYYKEIAKFSTWVYTIAGNLAKTELRRRKRHKIFSVSNFVNEDRDFDIPDTDHSPERKVDGTLKEDIIQKAIDKLPPKFKEVIILRDVQGFAYEEISQILSIPLGTVKSRVNRGRLKLQEDLKFLFESEPNNAI
ncbi:RNA polymerase subunit sigma-24 [candidate division KSB1 bacterium 4484_188]|nr:MAG: RNA polymerase subunit sigma-24 [candidate division KSB1 bacterium 4484_188]HFE63037.1 sigma-70 family RNA polymerase sigma factor [Caldithrix sp.]